MLVVALCAAIVCAASTPKPPSDPTPGAAPYLRQAPDLRAPDIQGYPRPWELTVAMTAGDQPPFYYVGPDGQLAGLDATLARDIASGSASR